MNTRLQVEHPVTELVTGLDLVRLQVEIAAGAHLPFTQPDIAWQGAAVECRIYAEDPDNQFFPSPGKITSLAEPAGPGVRLDSGVYSGWTVPLEHDPMLAKLAVWAGTRDYAIARALRAMGEYHVGGIATNLAFFRDLLNDPEFRAGNLQTGFLDAWFERRPRASARSWPRSSMAQTETAVAATTKGELPEGKAVYDERHARSGARSFLDPARWPGVGGPGRWRHGHGRQSPLHHRASGPAQVESRRLRRRPVADGEIAHARQNHPRTGYGGRRSRSRARRGGGGGDEDAERAQDASAGRVKASPSSRTTP